MRNSGKRCKNCGGEIRIRKGRHNRLYCRECLATTKKSHHKIMAKPRAKAKRVSFPQELGVIHLTITYEAK